jgi:hypothetical protein
MHRIIVIGGRVVRYSSQHQCPQPPAVRRPSIHPAKRSMANGAIGDAACPAVMSSAMMGPITGPS